MFAMPQVGPEQYFAPRCQPISILTQKPTRSYFINQTGFQYLAGTIGLYYYAEIFVWDAGRPLNPVDLQYSHRTIDISVIEGSYKDRVSNFRNIFDVGPTSILWWQSRHSPQPSSLDRSRVRAAVLSFTPSKESSFRNAAHWTAKRRSRRQLSSSTCNDVPDTHYPPILIISLSLGDFLWRYTAV